MAESRVTPTKRLLEELARKEKEALDARENTTLKEIIFLAEKAEVSLSEIGVAYRFALDSRLVNPERFKEQLGEFESYLKSSYFPFGGQKYLSQNDFVNKARSIFRSN